MMFCTRCQGTGFLNLHQLPASLQEVFRDEVWRETVLRWIDDHDTHDVQVCDCCGHGHAWWGEPGQHNPHSGEPWPPECI